MLPDTAKATPEARFMHSAALAVSETITWEQAAYFSGCSVEELLGALDDPAIGRAVDAEVARLRLSGDLASIKAARLTDSMLDKLLATPDEEISTGLAMKLAELGLKFREKAAPEAKAEAPKAEILIWHEGDPEPAPVNDDRYRVIIRLKNLKPARVIDHEDVTDAE